jgi:hypothetical protein
MLCTLRWFSGKSDVWRLLQDLADCMDGRVWPAKDKPKVQGLDHTRYALSLCMTAVIMLLVQLVYCRRF